MTSFSVLNDGEMLFGNWQMEEEPIYVIVVTYSAVLAFEAMGMSCIPDKALMEHFNQWWITHPFHDLIDSLVSLCWLISW